MRPLIVSALISALLAITWIAYSPGFSGTLHFDDRANLDPLLQADSNLELLRFVFEGKAGPLGRPIALASFALQKDHWPDHLAPLLQTNALLHIGTGAMVFALALGLARAIQFPRPFWVALLTCSLWVLSPFLASTTLMLIQRMSVLAGFFAFAGLAAYVWGRMLLQTRPRAGFWLMTLGLVIGTILATLSKENGALVPALALVIEITLLRHYLPIKAASLRLFLWIFLALPTALVATYLALRIPGIFTLSSVREIAPIERAWSQPTILWDYVRNLLIPNTASVTPFSDDRTTPSIWTNPSVLAATAAWIAVVASAMKLRHAGPWLLFGVAFFLVGHALESTIINLELYYAHRNYVPAFGLYFAVAAAVILAMRFKPKLIGAGAVAYVLAFSIVLTSTTSLWGQPLVAGEIWLRQHPESQRAHQFLANQYFRIGDPYTANRVLEFGAPTDGSGSLAMQRLFTCVFEEPRQEMAAKEAEQAANEIRGGKHNNGIGSVLVGLTAMVARGQCDAISHEDLSMLAEAVLTNPAYQSSIPIKTQVYNSKALIAQAQGNTSAAIEHVGRMYALSRHVNHAKFYSALLAADGRSEEALEFLVKAQGDVPSHPIRRWIRNMEIEQHIARIAEDISLE
ncbi:hypothetical protein TVNIR_0049 [Thioalkalivibrio nitratireducens DSM 14787]|uniref:Tetratricopeptide repeat protein n=1 Tax=Thioalkalivibrio nitratireducens (strain DSM 14787 / UNIQEM 213 / ALEN2) TaxID=1255043 RepID=L0DQL2_THIND|nr:hypothetical protein [Thioalkalivibrio nitratireducens]AGA31764.1 hypothetical protein TVNIR_0049 [Thioalkalivibrio nitratireducens DSM 14787]